MATRSTISIEKADGTVKQVYCHWDGFPESVGRTLKENYQTPEIVEELINLGDMSSLGKTIGTKHDFDNRPEEETTYYGRDRGGDDTEPQVYDDLETFLLTGQQEQYNYIFREGAWYLIVGKGKFVDYSIK